MTEFSDFKKALVANVKNVEAQKRVVAEHKKKATQLAAERERRLINYSFDQWKVKREQQRRVKTAVREERQRREQAQLEDEEAQGRANRALIMFMAKKETFLKEFDKVKSAIVDEVNHIPRMEDFYVAVMQKMGESAASLSDVFRIGERNCLKKLVDDFIEEWGMSLKAQEYFSVMVVPFLQPRPRRVVDDIMDLTRIMARAYS